MKLILKPKLSNDYIVTLASGTNYIQDFKNFVLDSWIKYCEINDLGLVYFDKELIEKSDPSWKKSNWQKFLIPFELKKRIANLSNICYLDTDILINPSSPNIFNYHKEDKITVVSQEKNLPYDLNEVRKKVSYFRHNYYSKNYKLDSSIFLTPKEIYKYHSIDEDVDDYICSGLYILNVNKYADFFKEIFFKYKNDDISLSGGEQFYFNFELFKLNKTNYIDYKFQALWVYEMAHYFPFLYYNKDQLETFASRGIQSSLLSNYFLHFAGSWHESELYKNKNILNEVFFSLCHGINEYKKQKIDYRPQGINKPTL